MQRLIAASLVHLRKGLKPGVLAVLASGWLVFALPAHAQSGGTIAGRVADETGGVLPGVTVDLHSERDGDLRRHQRDR